MGAEHLVSGHGSTSSRTILTLPFVLIVVLVSSAIGAAEPARTVVCSIDADLDGFCVEEDCDDTNADVYPGAPEVCDGVNNDCFDPDWPTLVRWNEQEISVTDDGFESVFAADVDGDGDADVLSASAGDKAIAWHENTAGDGSVWIDHEIAMTADYAAAVFAADVDGDGDVDVLSNSSHDDAIAWYENEMGDGSAWAEHLVSTSAHDIHSVFAADVDGDGDVDALSASWDDDTIAWYENTAGDGTGWITHRISYGTKSGALSVFAADVDGDGDVDVLSANNLYDTIVWHENTAGDGSTWAEHGISISVDNVRSIFAADVDGDGDVDALSASYSDDKLAWHENTAGDGSAWVERQISTAADGPDSLFAADLDGDGDVDVLAASWIDNKIAWYENTAGDGSAWTGHAVSRTIDADSLFAADVDGDGNLDVLAGSRTYSVVDGIIWYEHVSIEEDDDGDGLAECDGDCDDSTALCTTDCTDADWDGSPYCVDCDDGDSWSYPGADEACDGNDNACEGSVPADEVDVDGDGYVTCASWADVQGDQPAILGGGDCDGANAAIYPGAPEICDGVGNDCDDPGSPSPLRWNERGVSPTAEGAAFAADVDGDGDVDILSVASWEYSIAWHENRTGDGSAWIEHRIPTTATDIGSVVAADVDGDGDADVLSASPYSYGDPITWHENVVGDGSAWSTHPILATVNAASSLLTADVDGDGDVDVLSASVGHDTIAWYENTAGNGSTWTEGTISTTSDDVESIFAADVDGDGDVDVLSAFKNDTIAWHENTAGDGSEWTEQVISTRPSLPRSVFAADVDGDGDVDVLSASVGDDTIAWYENTAGDGSEWTEYKISTTAEGALSVFAVDLDGDDDMDVLSASPYDDTIAWHENTAGDGSEWTEHAISTTAVGYRLVFAADVDGDDNVDVLSGSSWDDAIVWYEQNSIEQDDDGDGLAECAGDCDDTAANCTTDCTGDADGDGTHTCADCDDGDASIYPGAIELCDGNDNVCAGSLSEGELDHDGDGYVECADWNDVQGDHPSILGGGDCDDANAVVYPGAPEICDGIASDCNHPNWPSLVDWDRRTISARDAGRLSRADIDGDGDVDVLVAPGCNHEFAWYENVARDGSAWVRSTIPTTGCANDVFAQDLDGDGDVDLLRAAYWENTIAWHENTAGDGSSWAEHLISTNAVYATAVFAADVDGDGDVDVLSASREGNETAWYENLTGDGSTWSVHRISTTYPSAESIFAIDLDGDGDVDVVSARHYGGITFHENTAGDGSTWDEHVISTNLAWWVHAADMDGDGDADILEVSQVSYWWPNTSAWHENTAGDGLAWTEHPLPIVGSGGLQLFPEDVDDDGDLDILSTSRNDDTIAWHENTTGDGLTWAEELVSISAEYPGPILAADVDSDGSMDVVASSQGDGIAWYRRGSVEEDGDGDGLAECEGDCDDTTPNCTTDCESDADGDGMPTCSDCDDDDATSYRGAYERCDGNDNSCDGWVPSAEVDQDGDGYVECNYWNDSQGDQPWILGSGDCDGTDAASYPGAPEICDGVNNDCSDPLWPALDFWIEAPISTADRAESVFAADVDGDGDLDVLAASWGSDTIAWYEKTAGIGSRWAEHVISTTADGASSVFAIDVDGDGDVDVLTASWYDDTIAWYENTAGNGSAWSGHEISTTAVGAFSVFGTDADGDGDVDVLAASVDDDTIALYENTTGDGSAWTEHLLSTTADGAASASGVDIDGDGDVDVLTASAYDDTIAWYERKPGVSSPWTAHPISTTADGVASAHGVDVDGDGDVDVLSASIYDDTIAWHENTAGDGSAWTAHEISTTVEGAYAVFGADLDGDGDVDALSASYWNGEVAWHENTVGDGSAWIPHVASSADDSSASVFAADLDGDDDLDVLWGAYERIAWYLHGSLEEDNDGDGLANCGGDCDDTTADCTTDCTDADGDGRAACHGDCDESDATSYPGAVELCDGNDNACNGWVSTDELDGDGDGYVPCDDWGDPQGDQPSILGGGDCDETNAATYPGAPEICDGANNDCSDPSWPLLESWTERGISNTADGARAVFAADMDSDGDVDVLSASSYAYSNHHLIAWHENLAGGGSLWTTHEISNVAEGADSIFAADVDGDGDVDVLASFFDADRIAWHENPAADGSAWVEHGISVAADGARAVFAADVDGDGDVDVLSAAYYDDTIAWHENTAGDGSAWAEHAISIAADGAESVFAADMDGDGDVDVLSASHGDDTIAWHENTAGDGSVWAEHEISITFDGAESVFAADMDGDGDVDVLATADLTFPVGPSIAWYERVQGSDSEWTEHEISTVASYASMAVFAADVDGDGDTDVLATSNYAHSSYSDTITWHENLTGSGAVWTERRISDADGATSIFAADVNDDGNVDVLAAAYWDDTIAWYEQGSIEEDDDGDGLAECEGDCDDSDPDCTTDCTGDADLDGTRTCSDCDDGDDASYPGAVELCDGNDNVCAGGVHPDELDGDGDGYVECIDWDDLQGDQPSILGGGDCDGADGATYPGAPEVCDGQSNDCSNPFWPSSYLGLEQVISADATAVSVTIADVDGDGEMDVLTASSWTDTIAWHENAAGDGSAWAEHPISTTIDAAESVFAIDVDGDGDVDALSASSDDDRIAWHENTAGDGSAWDEHTVSLTANGAVSVFAQDVDGDGDVDVLSASVDDDTVAWYENTTGDGSAWTEHLISITTGGARSVFALDVDGDGDVDVLSAAFDDGTVAWHENTAGDGSAWSEREVSTTAEGAWSVFAADVDGDGDVDVLSASAIDSTVAWYENTVGDGSGWNEHEISTTAYGAAAVFAVDMDGDGDVDVLSALYSQGTVAWYENTAGDGSAWTGHLISNEAGGARSVVAADVDGDGKVEAIAASQYANVSWYVESSAEDVDLDGLHCLDDCDDWNPNCTTDCTDVDGDAFCITTDCDDTRPYCTTDCTDADGDSFCVTNDCDEQNPDCNTDCSDVDSDGLRACEGDCDDGDPDCTTDCADGDGDGLRLCNGDCDDGKPNCTTDCTDTDGDGFCITTDCDDVSPACTTDCTDADEDGFRLCDGDCDDGDPGANPDETEDCTDGSDNDCNGLSDAVDPVCLDLSVADLRFAGGGRSTLEWSAAAAADRYALYRGTIPRTGFAGYDHLCEAAQLETTTAEDPDTPLRGESYYYLVTGQSVLTVPDLQILSGSLGLVSSGQSRPDSSTIDCGARVYVNPDLVAGSHDGLSWATAYTGVSGALSHGQSRDRDLEVWIRGSLEDSAVLHSAARSGARLLGGFAGTEEASWERSPETTSTTWAPRSSDVPVLRLFGTDVVLDALTLRDGGTGVLGDPAGRLFVIDNVRLEQFSGEAVELSFAEAAGSRLEVRDSIIEVAGTGGLKVVSTAGSLTGRIRGNVFQGSGGTALWLEAAPSTSDASVAVDVVANTISGVDTGIVLGAQAGDLPYDAIQSSFVGSNLIHGTQGSSIVVQAIGDFATSEQPAWVLARPLIVGNTLSDGGAAGLRCLASRTDTTGDPSLHEVRCDAEIWDNLITFHTGEGIEESSDDPATGLTCDPLVVGNDLYDNAAPYLDEGTTGLTIEEVNALAGAYDNYSADPVYQDPAGGDYHLLGETCVDAGHPEATRIATEDIDGEARVRDGDEDGTAKPDTGADER